jgi:hypothetical protein
MHLLGRGDNYVFNVDFSIACAIIIVVSGTFAGHQKGVSRGALQESGA